MKIMIITPFEKVSDSRAVRLANALESMGFEVQIRSTADEINGKFNNKIIRRIGGYISAFKMSKRAEEIIVSVNCEYTIIARIANCLRKKNKKIWADIYDNHEYIFNIQPYRFIFKVLEHCALLMCDAAIIPIERRMQQYSDIFLRIFKPKIYFISNIGFEKQNSENNYLSNTSKNNVNLVYAGTIDKGRGILPLVMAAENSNGFIQLEVYGSGPYLNEYLELKIFRKFYKGLFKFGDLKKIYWSADVISGFYELSVPNNFYCDPNKMREIFEFRKPILTNSGTPLADMIIENDIGVVIKTVDSASIIKGLRYLKLRQDEILLNINDKTIINNIIDLNNLNLEFLIKS